MSDYTVGRYHDGEGWRCVLAREGRTRLHLVAITDLGITHTTQPRDELRGLQPLLLKGKPYPLDRLLRHFRRIGRERGITEAAKAELSRAAGGLQ